MVSCYTATSFSSARSTVHCEVQGNCTFFSRSMAESDQKPWTGSDSFVPTVTTSSSSVRLLLLKCIAQHLKLPWLG